MTTSRVQRLAVGLLAGSVGAWGLCLAGCNQCGGVICDACGPPFSVHVTDADTGLMIDDVEVVGANGLCEGRPDLGYTLCEVWLEVGTWEFELRADGYDDLALGVTINPDSGESCCSCGYNPKRRDAQMVPAS